MDGLTASRRLVGCVGLLLLTAIAVRVIEGGNGKQVFAAFSAAKRVTLPLTYLLILLAVVIPSASYRNTRRPRVPAWLWMPSAGILVSLAAEVVRREPTNTSNLLQGLVLFIGFTLIGWFSLGATGWDTVTKRRLTWLLMGGAAVSGLFAEHGLTPFLTLSVPGFFAALTFTVYPGERSRTLYASFSLLLGFLMIRGMQPDSSEPASSAVVGQIVICGALVTLSVIPRHLRRPVVGVALIAGLTAFDRLHGIALLTGKLSSGDVTIAQRSFEAGQVLDKLSTSTLPMLIGSGPGATVNLSRSPDALTLAASGRHLVAVDDVHLLTAYLLLKLGAFGILWLVVLLAALVKATGVALRAHADRGWRIMMLLFALAGVVNAFPAATNLLTNPLVPLCIGVLFALSSGISSNPGDAHARGSLRRQTVSSPGRPENGP